MRELSPSDVYKLENMSTAGQLFQPPPPPSYYICPNPDRFLPVLQSALMEILSEQQAPQGGLINLTVTYCMTLIVTVSLLSQQHQYQQHTYWAPQSWPDLVGWQTTTISTDKSIAEFSFCVTLRVMSNQRLRFPQSPQLVHL